MTLFDNPITDEVDAAIKEAKPLVENDWDLKKRYKPLLENLETVNTKLRECFLAIRNEMVVNLADGAGEMDLSNIPEGEQRLFKIFQEYLDIEFDEDEENE